MDKTESYIVLKPIAERFNRIAKEITDKEIKDLIMSELRSQVGTINLGKDLSYIIDEYIENNSKDIMELAESAIRSKFNWR